MHKVLRIPVLPHMIVALVFATSCDETPFEDVETCTVDATLSASTADPGDVLELTGGPFTELGDTTVLISGVVADVDAVERTDCTLCDECEATAEDCAICGECTACDSTCADCVEVVRFVVPELEDGEYDVILVNAWGSTAPLELLIGDVDTDAQDSDTDSVDTDTPDTDDTDVVDTDDTDVVDTDDTDVVDTDAVDTDITDTDDTDTAPLAPRRPRRLPVDPFLADPPECENP